MLAFAVLRRAKNVRNADESERELLLADAEKLENVCMWLVFGGIALEAVIVLASFGELFTSLGEKFAYLLADAAIAVGVYGKMRFGHVAGDILKLELAQGLREVKYLRSSRRAVLAGKELQVIAAISPFAGTKFDVGIPPPSFTEAWDFNWDIEPLFIRTGWTFVDWVEPSSTFPYET